MRVTNRPGQQLLGANGRDEGPPVCLCTCMQCFVLSDANLKESLNALASM